MAQYMLLVYQEEVAAAEQAERETVLPALVELNRSLREAGLLVGVQRLRSTESATSVRVRDGRTEIVDGPFAGQTWTVPLFSGMSSAVATALRVTPAQATSASSSMSPEHSSAPEPPVAGCSPAVASARPVSTLQAMLLSSSVPLALSVINAAPGSLL